MVRTLATLGVVCAISAAAQATPLNLNLLAFPELSSTQIDVAYNASSLLLTANGYSIAYEDDGLVSTPPHPVFSGVFSISLTVSHSGIASAGTLTIGGAIPDLFIPNQVLLSGSMTDFGFTTSGAGRLEFLFGSLGGALGPAFLARGPQAGVILNNVTGFPYNFNSSWSNLTGGQAGSGTAVSDSGAILPAPSAALILAFGGLATARRRR